MPYKIPPAHPRKYMNPGFGGEWATANLGLQDCTTTCKDGSLRIPTKSNEVIIFFKYSNFILIVSPILTVLGYELWSQTNHLHIMEQLMLYGPLQVSMHIYNDFRYYKEGNL